jgi:pyruvate dehydrogenase E1 component alpha subunit
VKRARAGQGATFIVCNTYRFRGHHVGDQQRAYRSREEEKEWQARDPITRYAAWLMTQNYATADKLEQLDAEVEREVEDGIAFAKAAPFPSASEVSQHVYAG